MANQIINIGTTANDGTGDTWRDALDKTNDNFAELYSDNLASTIVVNQSNLATTLGGTIDSTKVYVLDGVVDFTGLSLNISVPAAGISIIGSTFDVSKIICSDASYTLFVSPAGNSGNILSVDYAIEITGAGSQVYSLTDATGSNAFEFTRINYNDCTSLGTITGYRQGLEDGTGRFGGSPELTLAGTWAGGYFIDTSIVRSLTNSAYTLYKAGAGFTMASRFRTNQNVDLPALVSLLDFSTSNFTNPSTLQIDGAIITRNGVSNPSDTNITPNINESDLASSWTGNQGMRNTFVGGTQTLSTEVATTISTINTFVDVLGTWTATDLQHFDAPANGQLRNKGTGPVEYRLMSDFVIDGTSGDVLAVKVVKWDNSASGFVDIITQRRQVNALVGARDVCFFSISTGIDLDQDDYIKLQIENQSAGRNATIELDSFFTVLER